MTPFVRRRILPLHRWTGLTIGVLLVWMALTGAGMVFQKQLGPLLDRKLIADDFCAQPRPIDEMVTRAAAVHLQAKPAVVWWRPGSGASATVRFSDNDIVYLDPCSGRVLGQGHRYEGLFGRLEWLHRLKFLPSGGLIVGSGVLIGVVGLMLMGIVLWWASRRPAGGMPTRSTRGTSNDTRMRRHRWVGIAAVAILLGSALTGLTKSFAWYRDGIIGLTASLPEFPPVVPPNFDMKPAAASLQSIVTHMGERYPATREVRLYLSKADSPVVGVELLARDAPNSEAYTRLYYGARSGDLLDERPYASTSRGSRLIGWMVAWHKATVGGMVGQLIVFAGALSMVYLGWTGIGSYLRTRALRRRHRLRVAGR